MKEVKAYIKRHKLDDVSRALHRVEGVTGMSVSDCRGYGIGWAKTGAPEQIDYHPGVRVEVICRDDLVEQVVAAVEKFAHTGLKGDGKIYVTAIEEAVRISTGERGEAAV
ncbi:MAG: P-II family nitrogen regulator [Deltaproteobacteria bacterium]|jgi:nitrogen regulatory protein P-II 1|nr:P-II family nitrogen regulator [Deltaproteobacteria bacterium]